MKKVFFALLVCGSAIGWMLPSEEPSEKATQAQASGLFEAPPYKETQLRQRANGHFYVDADVNGSSINFVVDTGASVVALTEADARTIGLQFSRSEFEPVAQTASGIARGKRITLPKITIEGKEVMEVDAMIIEGAGLSLLGQSYLSRITSVEMNGDIMVLR